MPFFQESFKKPKQQTPIFIYWTLFKICKKKYFLQIFVLKSKLCSNNISV